MAALAAASAMISVTSSSVRRWTRALPSRIVDKIETAGEKAKQNRHNDRIAGLPEGKAIK